MDATEHELRKRISSLEKQVENLRTGLREVIFCISQTPTPLINFDKSIGLVDIISDLDEN